MEKRELVCIGCPIGCVLCAEISDEGNVRITENSCKIGEDYGIKECTNPTRIVTSTVEVIGRKVVMLPVKTERDIPKNKIEECMKALKGIKLTAPINMGDIILKNVSDHAALLCTLKLQVDENDVNLSKPEYYVRQCDIRKTINSKKTLKITRD